ncbi:MAG TPA: cell wall anchor protein, partial [Pseudonocardiaceae bacterium]|nr:cell wall anchor protein [Pseudonocardiaceae bacterium]
MARGIRARAADAAGNEAASLVESAMLLRWRAPELALLLADRAVSVAQDDKMAVLRADHLAAFTLNRLGRHAEAVHRLFPAIRDADMPPGLRHELHVELAQCAAALGEPTIALSAAHPVLAAGDDVSPALRGGALVAMAQASAALTCDDLVASALEEADELYREDPGLDHDTGLLLRAAVQATGAGRHRARGAADEAEAKIQRGRELLAGLADPDHDSGEVSARLMLELVLLLLDRGAGEAAMNEARPLLRRPVRAAAAAAAGRLRLALATRVHLAEGRHDSALTLLADAVEGAQRYGMDAVLAECLQGLSHVHEARDEFADALHCVRAAQAAEDRHLQSETAARSSLREHLDSARRD